MSVSDVKVGDQFTVDVLVKGVIDLAGWQTDLLFDSDILEFKQVEEGSFLKQGEGQTFWLIVPLKAGFMPLAWPWLTITFMTI